MGYFNYHISTHLLRPASIISNISYTPGATANPIPLTPNVEETSVITSPFDGNAINRNFYNLALSATDLTFRVSTLESYSNNAESGEVGFVNYNGRKEKEATFYGGSPLYLQGASAFTLPYTMDNSNKKAFQIAALDGILYTPNIDTVNSRFRPIIFGEVGAGSPFASLSSLVGYLNSKLKFNSNDGTNTFTIIGSVTPSWTSDKFGDLTLNPKSFYVFWNDGYTQYAQTSPVLTYTDSSNFIRKLSNSAIVGTKVTLGNNIAANDLNLLASALKNALSIAIGNTTTFDVVIKTPGNYLQLVISNDRTQNGIYQVTLQKDSNDSGDGILDWLGWINNVSSTTNPESLPANTSEAYDYSSLFTFTISGSGPYNLDISGTGAYFNISFIDGYLSNPALLSGFGLSSLTTTYYHTRHPLESYNKVLNYGGNLLTRDLTTTNDLIVQGNLTVNGSIQTPITSPTFYFPSYIQNSSFEYNTSYLSPPPNWIPYANTSASSVPTSGGIGTIYTYTVTISGGTPTAGQGLSINGIVYTLGSDVTDSGIATQLSKIIQAGYSFTYLGGNQFSIAVSGAYPNPVIDIVNVVNPIQHTTFPVSTNYGIPSNAVTLLVNNINPLFGLYDVIFSKDGNNRQGQGFSVPFSIDLGANSQCHQLSFYYKTSSNYTSGDLSVFIYDITNSNLIPLSVTSIPSSPSSGLFLSTFYPSSSIEYALIFHIASTSSSIWTFEFDNISVCPQNPYLVINSQISGWTKWTPTLVGFGTITSDEIYWKRSGDTIEIQGKFTAGTSTATQAQLPLPYGLTTSTLPSATIIGKFDRGNASATTLKQGVIFTGTLGTNTLYFGSDDYTTASSPLTALNGSTVCGTGEVVLFHCKVPIAQWSVSSNLITDFTEYASNTDTANGNQTSSSYFYNGIDGSSIPTGITSVSKKRVQFSRYIQPSDKLELEVYDNTLGTWMPVYNNSVGSLSHSVQNTNSYGIYFQYPSSGNLLTQIDVVFNSYARPTGATYGAVGEAWSYYDGAQRTISRWRLRKTSRGNTAEQIPLIRAEYTVSDTHAFETSTNQINFLTKVEDTNSAVTVGSSWKFTAPAQGVYSVSVMAETAAGQYNIYDYMQLDLYKNGVINKRLAKTITPALGSSLSLVINGNANIRLNPGDYIDVRVTYSLTNGSKPTTWNSTSYPVIQIVRTGN